MIRKTIIVALALAAGASGVMWIASDWWVVSGAAVVPKFAFFRVDCYRGYIRASAVGTSAPDWLEGSKFKTHFSVVRSSENPLSGWLIERRLERGWHVWWRGRAISPGIVEPGYGVLLPLWSLAIVFLAYPAIAFIRGPVRRRRRRRRGLCVTCGYDLTGLPEPRCPECATQFEPR